MKRYLTLLLIALLSSLSACSLHTPLPEKSTFTLGAQRAQATPPHTAKFASLRISTFRTAQANRSAALIYRETDQRIVADPYRGLIAAPAILLSERTRQWLADSGLFSNVLPSDTRMLADLTLEGEISELYADVRDPQHPAAVIALRAWLLDTNGKLVRPEWRFQRRIAVANADAASIVAAYDQAMSVALGDLENALAQ